MAESATFDTTRWRPKVLLTATVLLLSALAWLQLFGVRSIVNWGLPNAQPTQPMLAHLHEHMHQAAHVHTLQAWTLRDVGLAFLMWLLMAVAMMLPTAIPAILAFTDMARATERGGDATGRIGFFVSGYLLAWWGFGVLATGVQWMLANVYRGSAASGMEYLVFAGLLIMASGGYQFSALKDLCLTQCRSPVTFFLAHWRDGVRGAVSLGSHHGLYCIGCCWALMALMLLAGAMSLGWTAALSAVMLLEKVFPGGRMVSRIVGTALIVGGGVLVCTALAHRGFS